MNVKHILQNTSEDDHTSLFKKLYCPIGSTAREAFGCFFQEIRNLIKFSKYSDFFFFGHKLLPSHLGGKISVCEFKHEQNVCGEPSDNFRRHHLNATICYKQEKNLLVLSSNMNKMFAGNLQIIF